MTPTQAPNTGIEVLGPGDPTSSDGFKFTGPDRLIIDRLLRLAWAHHHDAHAALADPSLAATLTPHTTGGTVPSRLSLAVCYTLIDADGGETLATTPVTAVTGGGFLTVSGAPTVALDSSAGTLLAADYSYALTVADGLGGETPIGPVARITVPPGLAHAQVDLSNLAVILAATSGGASGASWRLWRKRGGASWYLIATGTAATFVDNGVAGDCTVQPPFQSTITGTNSFDVTVPAGQPADAVNFAIYMSTDGSFNSPSLLGIYPIADAGTVKTFTTITRLPGAPPFVSNAVPGPSKIAPNTELTFGVKSPVATSTALAAGVRGDVRVALDTHHIWGVLGATATVAGDWTDLSGGGGGGGFPALTFRGFVSSGGTLLTNSFYYADASATAFTLNLPGTATVGDVVAVWKADTSANKVTVGGAAIISEISDGGAVMVFIWDGSEWTPFASFTPSRSWATVTLGTNVVGAWGTSNQIGPEVSRRDNFGYFQGGFKATASITSGVLMTLPANCRPSIEGETNAGSGFAIVAVTVVPFDTTFTPQAAVRLRIRSTGSVTLEAGSLASGDTVYLDGICYPLTIT